jgi:hypothetical protein
MISNNETLGMSCEQAICEIFDQYDAIDEKRYNRNTVNELKSIVKKFLDDNSPDIKLNYVGGKGNLIDFKDLENKTYSIKTNNIKGNMVCPQDIGQSTRSKFNEKLYRKISNDEDPDYELSDDTIRKFITQNPHKLFVEYFKKLFCCDYLLHVKCNKLTNNNTFEKFNITMHQKLFLNYTNIKDDKIIFTNQTNNWKSNTMKIQVKNEYISIGEFQIHTSRNSIKFRFNFPNLLKYYATKIII